jgi:hypothetical protein
MIITKEQQERIVDKYVKEKHNTDECIGFIDGINATIELINKLTIPVVIVPKGTVCECENPDICQDNTGLIYCFECKEPMVEQTAL